MIRALVYILLILQLALMTSCRCERSLEGNEINLFGGIARTNSFENYGNFYHRLPATSIPRTNGDSSGSNIPPLIFSSGEYCLATIRGTVVYTTLTNVLWERKLDSGETAASSMAADKEHNIYVISNQGKLYSYSKSGNKRWVTQINDSISNDSVYSDLLTLGNQIIIGSESGLILGIDSDGNKKWERKSIASVTKTLAADADGNIYALMTLNEFDRTDTLISLDKSGKERWSISFENNRLIKNPVISDGKIYIIGILDKREHRVSKIYCINSEGKKQWETELAIFLRFLSVDSKGNIYASGYNSGLGETMSGIYCYDDKANFKWKIFFEMSIPAPVMIASDMIAVVGMTKKAPGVFFMDKDGVLFRTVSLSEEPTVFLQADVTPGGNITFASTERLAIVRIDETPLNKMLPY